MTNPFSSENLAPTWTRATAILKGDLPGHEFHGNQYTTAVSANGHEGGKYTKRDDGTYDFHDTSDYGWGPLAQDGVILDGRSIELRNLEHWVDVGDGPENAKHLGGNLTISLEPGSSSFRYLAGKMIRPDRDPERYIRNEGYKFSYPEGTGDDITPDTVIMYTNNDTPEPKPFATVSQIGNFIASDPAFFVDAYEYENTYD